MEELDSREYLQQLLALLPHGRAWPRHPDAFLTTLFAALAEEFARIDSSASDLINESDPRTASDISGWERVLACEGRTSVVSRLRMEGSLAVNFYARIAGELLGYQPEIRERPIPRLGALAISPVGARLWPVHERYRWFVVLDSERTNVDDYDREPLESLIQTTKPAHTTVHVGFSGPFRVAKSQVGKDLI